MDDEKRGTKCTVEIPDRIFKAAKHQAVDERGGLRGVIVRALEAYLIEKGALRPERKRKG